MRLETHNLAQFEAFDPPEPFEPTEPTSDAASPEAQAGPSAHPPAVAETAPEVPSPWLREMARQATAFSPPPAPSAPARQPGDRTAQDGAWPDADGFDDTAGRRHRRVPAQPSPEPAAQPLPPADAAPGPEAVAALEALPPAPLPAPEAPSEDAGDRSADFAFQARSDARTERLLAPDAAALERAQLALANREARREQAQQRLDNLTLSISHWGPSEGDLRYADEAEFDATLSELQQLDTQAAEDPGLDIPPPEEPDPRPDEAFGEGAFPDASMAPEPEPAPASPDAELAAGERNIGPAPQDQQDPDVAGATEISEPWEQQETEQRASDLLSRPRPSDGTNEYARDMELAAIVVSPDLPAALPTSAAQPPEATTEAGAVLTLPVPTPAPAVVTPLPVAQRPAPAADAPPKPADPGASSTTGTDVAPPAAAPAPTPLEFMKQPDGQPVLLTGAGPAVSGLLREAPDLAFPYPSMLDRDTRAQALIDGAGQVFWKLEGPQVPGGSATVVVAAPLPAADAGTTPDSATDSAADSAATPAATLALALSDADRLTQINAWLLAQGRVAVAGLAEAATAVADVLQTGARLAGAALEAAEVASLAGLAAVAGAINLVLIPPSRNGITPLGDDQRFVSRPDELYGQLQARDDDGRWQTVKTGVRLVLNGSERQALSEEEIAQLAQPLINVPGPQQPGSPPPLLTPDPADLARPLPGFGSTDPLAPIAIPGQLIEIPHWSDFVFTMNQGGFDWDHVLDGEINKRGAATGYHAEIESSLGKARIKPGATVTQYPNGTYEAQVQIWNAADQVWVDKRRESTFFPADWTRERIEAEVTNAYTNRIMIGPNKWQGSSPSGVVIEGYISPDRITFYPLKHP